MHQPCEMTDCLDFYIAMGDEHTYVMSDMFIDTSTPLGFMDMTTARMYLTYATIFFQTVKAMNDQTLIAHMEMAAWQQKGGRLS